MDGDSPHLQTNGKAAPPPDLADDCDVTLSARERQLLRRFALGKPDKSRAKSVGPNSKFIDRLQIQSQAQLVTLAAQLASWPARRANGIFLRKGRR